MIDNFNKIFELIEGKSSEGEFYFLQIIKRRKDNPTMSKNAKTIETYQINNSAELLKQKDTIIGLCEQNNARAYFNINKRSYKQIALETNALVARNIANGNYNIQNCYESCCGKYHSEPKVNWILDMDDDYNMDLAIEIITDLQKQIFEKSKGHKDYKIITRIPTKNGEHLITNKFNVMEFKKRYKLPIEIKKDNATILYIP